MKLTLEIENTEDAIVAKRVIEAYAVEGSTGMDIKISEDKSTKASEEVAEDKPAKKPVAKKAATKKPVAKKEVVEEDEEVETEAAAESDMDLKTLTAIAKEAVSKSDRATVKDVIGEFGDKLSSVDEADYDELAKKLRSL